MSYNISKQEKQVLYDKYKKDKLNYLERKKKIEMLEQEQIKIKQQKRFILALEKANMLFLKENLENYQT